MMEIEDRERGRSRAGASRYAAWQRVTARTILFAFLWAPVAQAGEATSTQAVGDVTNTAGDADLTVDTDTHTQWTQNTEALIQDYATDLKQPDDHLLEYVQDPGDRALLRFPGITDTEFWGSLHCDATCVVANPSGVHFRDGSFVDVGKLITVTGDITNAKFIAGEMDFTTTPGGEVSNAGTIYGNSVALIGDRVANFGHISVPDGSLFMLSGDQVILKEHGSPVIIQATVPAAQVGTLRGPGVDVAAVENAGTIDAGKGHVRLAAGDMLALAIRNSGGISAARIELEAGEQGYVEVTGTLDASDTGNEGVGGHVEVLGDFVAIRDGALIDASGTEGGGEVLIGGDQSGRGDERRARATYVAPDAEIRANALREGDGGRIVVWSDEVTQSYGRLAARGGRMGGDGGFIETSSRGWLDTRGVPDLGAPAGLGGTWLLDPNNVSIVSMCSVDAPQCMDEGFRPIEFLFDPQNPTAQLRPSINDSQVGVEALTEALADGFAVIISTEQADIDDAETGQVGNIVVAADIVIGEDDDVEEETSASLTLRAANDITFEGADEITNTNSNLTLSLRFVANDFTQDEAEDTGDAGLAPNAYRGDAIIDADIRTGGGSVELQGANVVLAAGRSIETQGGFVGVSSAGGDITIAGRIDTSAPEEVGPLDEILIPTGGDVVLTAGALRRPISQSDDSTSDVFGGDILIDSGDTTPAEIVTRGGDVEMVSLGGDIVINGDLDTVKADAEGGGAVRINAERLVPSGDVIGDETPYATGGFTSVQDGGRIYTGGGELELGLAGSSSDGIPLEGSWEILVRGDIDTRRMTAWGEDDGSETGIDWFEGLGATEQQEVVDATRQGGNVLMQTVFATNTESAGTGITFDGSSRSGGGSVETQGGLFGNERDDLGVPVENLGAFAIVDYTIDTRRSDEMPEEQGLSSISLRQVGDVSVGGASTLLASESVELQAGRFGVGDVSIGVDAGDDVTIGAREIDLTAGNGYTPDTPTQTSSRIEIGASSAVTLQGADDSTPTNPEAFRFIQDASIEAGDLPSATHFASGDFSEMEFEVAANDGTVAMDVSDLIGPSSGIAPSLQIDAASDVSLLANLPAGTLASLDIAIAEDFTVDSALANAIGDTLPTLRIRAGALGNVASGDLTVSADLTATDSLVLQAGAGGTGDLRFAAAGGVDLDATSIVLRAGSGRSDPEIIDPATLPSVDATQDVRFGSSVAALRIWQDRAIDDESVPDESQFDSGNGYQGLEFGLRSDLGTVTLDESVPRLEDSYLSLHGYGGQNPILIESTGSLRVRSLDIGGIDDFNYTSLLADKIGFVDDAESKLVLRAGIAAESGRSFLTFEDGVEVRANEIRLVAGDGAGLTGNIGDDGSYIELTGADGGGVPVFRNAVDGERIETFVFRQDAEFTSEDLPSLADFDGLSPETYGIRSDRVPDPAIEGDGAVAGFTIEDFESDRLPSGQDRLVISSRVIAMQRSDGDDLDLNDFSSGGDGLELRGDVIELVAQTPDDPGSTPGVIAAGGTQLRGFEGILDQFDASSDPDLGLPLALDVTSALDTEIESTPFSILIDQEADIAAADLLDPGTQLFNDPGDKDAGGLFLYTLRSSEGSVQLRPDKVVNSDLAALGLGENGTIVFDGPTSGGTDPVYAFRAFRGVASGAMDVESAGGGTLEIVSEDFISLQSGTSGQGDLRFGPNVTLEGRRIDLRAGPDLLGEQGAVDPDDAPIVDAYTNAPDFILTKQDEDDLTVFTLAQHGALISEGVQAPTQARASRLPVASQFQQKLAGTIMPGAIPVEGLEYESQLGEILISSINDANGLANTAKRVRLLAGRFIEDADGEGLIRLGPKGLAETATGSLDLTGFVWFQTFSDAVELIARGAGAFVKAESDAIRFFGPGDPNTPPARFQAVQDESFDETQDPSGCDFGCLPRARQFGGGLVVNELHVDYTIESTGGTILLDERIGNKVWDSRLTLAASNSNGSAWDVKIEPAHSPRVFIDLLLESLVVKEQGEDAADSTLDILLSDDTSDTDGDTPEPPRIFVRRDSNYHGDVRVDGLVELLGGNIFADSTVEPDSGNTTFHGTVGAAVAGDSTDVGVSQLIVSMLGETTFLDDIAFGTGNGSLLQVNGVLLQEGFLPSSSFAKAGGGQTVQAGTVQFQQLPDFDATQPSVRVAPVPTIKAPNGDLTFEADTFEMSVGEKLTVVGRAEINAASAARIGDISALEIEVNSPSIVIVGRPAGDWLDANGVPQPDGGVDFVANTIDFDGNIILDTNDGQYRKPVFGLQRPLSAPGNLQSFSIAALNPAVGPLDTADFFADDGSLLDLHPGGGSRDDISTIFFEYGLIPQPRAWIPSPWLVPDSVPMAELDIRMRPTRPSEHLSRMRGAPIIDDVGSDLLLEGEEVITVAEARLSTTEADRAVEIYQRVFGADGERAEHVRGVLQRALDLYRRTSGANRIVGFELRRYVKNRPSTQFEAYEILEDLDLLFTYHRMLGLTPGEYRPIQYKWLAQVQPQGISLEELSEAIHPSRYVRGSDVLDIFGE